MKSFLLITGALVIFSFVTLPVDGKGHHEDQIEIADNKTYQCNPCCRGPPGRDGRDGPPGPPTTISHVDYVHLKEDLTKDVKQQFTAEVTANETAIKGNDCPGNGKTQDKPASSCRAIFFCYQHNATSGYYWIKGEIDGNIIIKRVYCNMEDTRCGIRGGWMRVAHIDMTDLDDICHSPLRTITSPNECVPSLCPLDVPQSRTPHVVFPTPECVGGLLGMLIIHLMVFNQKVMVSMVLMWKVYPSLMVILENIFGHMQPGSLKITITRTITVHVQFIQDLILLRLLVMTITVNQGTLAVGRLNGTPMTPCGTVRGVLQEITAALLVGCHGFVEHYLVRLRMTLR